MKNITREQLKDIRAYYFKHVFPFHNYKTGMFAIACTILYIGLSAILSTEIGMPITPMIVISLILGFLLPVFAARFIKAHVWKKLINEGYLEKNSHLLEDTAK